MISINHLANKINDRIMKILVLNAGSSSQKSCLYDLPADNLPTNPPEPIWEAMIDWTVLAGKGVLTVKANGVKQKIELANSDRRSGISQMLNTLQTGETQVLNSLTEIDMVGHRVVHGGTNYSQATLITDEVKTVIRELIPLAPAHNPAHLEGVETIESLLKNTPLPPTLPHEPPRRIWFHRSRMGAARRRVRLRLRALQGERSPR